MFLFRKDWVGTFSKRGLMKKILMFLVVMCAFANAQVYYANPQQQQSQQPVYYSVDQLPPGAVVVAPQVQDAPVYPVSAAPVNYADSAEHYESLANQYYETHIAGKSNGTAKIIIGSVGIALGVASLIIVGTNDDDFCDEVYSDGNNYECEANAAGTVLILGGLGVGITGGVFLGVGIANKARYNRAVRNVDRLRSKADSFRRALSNVYVVPEIDPFKKEYGAKLAYNF